MRYPSNLSSGSFPLRRSVGIAAPAAVLIASASPAFADGTDLITQIASAVSFTSMMTSISSISTSVVGVVIGIVGFILILSLIRRAR